MRGRRRARAPCSRSSASTVAWFVDRVRAVERGQVEHVHEQAAALHVGEELVPEAGALAGALDQAGDVRHHELAVVALERAEHRLERGERVVGHLRLRARERRRAATTCRRSAARRGRRPRAACSRSSSRALLARAGRCSAKRGAWRVDVAKWRLPRPPRRRAPRPRAARRRVRSQRSPAARGPPPPCPGGTRTSSASGRRAVAVGALAVAAARGLEVRPRRNAARSRSDGSHDEHHVAAAAAVAAVGTALRHVRLAPEGDTPFPPAPPCT